MLAILGEVVMGLSAARLHENHPARFGNAIVAVPRQHRLIALTDRPATVWFVQLDTSRLDAERIASDLGPVLVTTPEQTFLDMAHRPTLGDNDVDTRSAAAALYARSDENRLRTLAPNSDGLRRYAAVRTGRGWSWILTGETL